MTAVVGCTCDVTAAALHRAATAFGMTARLMADPFELFVRPFSAADGPDLIVVALPGLNNDTEVLLELRLATAGLDQVRLVWAGESSSPLVQLARLRYPGTATEFPTIPDCDLSASRVFSRFLHDELKNPLLNLGLRLRGPSPPDPEVFTRIGRSLQVLQSLHGHSLAAALHGFMDELQKHWTDTVTAIREENHPLAVSKLALALPAVVSCQSRGGQQWTRLCLGQA